MDIYQIHYDELVWTIIGNGQPRSFKEIMTMMTDCIRITTLAEIKQISLKWKDICALVLQLSIFVYCILL